MKISNGPRDLDYGAPTNLNLNRDRVLPTDCTRPGARRRSGPSWTESARPSRARFSWLARWLPRPLSTNLEIRVKRIEECLGLNPAEGCIGLRPGGPNWPRRARALPCVRSQVLPAASPPRPSRGPHQTSDPRYGSRRPLSPIRVSGILANGEYAESGPTLTLATGPSPSAGKARLSTLLPARQAS